MEELNQKFAIATTNQELKFLADTFQYDAVGIIFLIELLNHSNLEIRAKAYQLLQNIDSKKVRQASSKGILLNPGDRVYTIYKSSIYFNDSFYSLFNGENCVLELNTDYDYKRHGYKIIKDDGCLYIVAKSPHYFSRSEAEAMAESLHQKIMLKWSLGDFEFDWIDKAQNFNVKQWCLANKISYQEVKRIQREKFYKNGLDKLFTPEELVEGLEFDRWDNCNEIMNLLKQTNNLNLLSKLWKETIGNFAGICEIHIGKTSYLKIDENLPDIVTPEQKIELLAYADYYEQSDIEFLIESLNNPEIKVRAMAYKLLQDAESKKVRVEIAQGLLQNPGDRVYSVWRSGIGFNDEAYYLVDACDLSKELIIEENKDFDYTNYDEFYDNYSDQYSIEENYQLSDYDYQDPEIESYESFFAEYIEQDESIKISDRQNRLWDELADLDLEIYSYERGDPLFVSRHICKNQAEKIAESLHQKIMKEHGIGSFSWDKINYLETWCIANNVPYQKKFYQDPDKDYLMSWFDTEHLMNYLKQPENIHLFSKLWKDAVGSFAFVCEQTVKNKTYLKIDVNCQC
ncbi:MAG: hypothetical protein ACRC2S_20235 [Waterburya sp.]